MENDIQNQNFLRIGSVLNNGRYRIENYIASGGFGNTYKALDTQQNTVCAIKEFFISGDTHREADSDNVSVSNPMKAPLFESLKQKFKKEARRLMEIHNPHVVHVYDSFEQNETAYYAMELIEGDTLSNRIKHLGRAFTEQEATDVLHQMLDALKSIHDKGIIHMDVKPANILMDSQGACKLIDFGASKQTEMDGGGNTTSSAVCFTQGYAPPEQVSGNKQLWGPWTDFYALGATIYNLISGNRPPTQDELSTFGKDALKFPAQISPKLKSVVSWMMQLSVKERPQSVNQIYSFMHDNGESTLVAVGPAVTDENTVVGPSNPDRPAPKKDKEHLVWIWVLILSVILIGGGIFACDSCQRRKAEEQRKIETQKKAEEQKRIEEKRKAEELRQKEEEERRKREEAERDPSVKNGFCPDTQHPHSIDLGIGVKFSCCNVGASVPWQYGGYYTYGQKNAPTKNQLEALVNRCRYQWSSLNGVKGGVFTGPNGNKIFLPAAGNRWSDGSMYGVGTGGYYWSSTPDPDDSDYAYSLRFYSDVADVFSYKRGFGRSVRQVTE